VSELAILSRVRPGREEALRRMLRALRSGGGRPSPFAGGHTHFARLVVIELDGPQLFFTARFDGEEDAYLAELANTPTALEAWRECEIGRELTAERLLEHLRDQRARVRGDYIISLLEPGITVAQVREGLALRRELSAFAFQAQELAPVELAHAFSQLPSVLRARSR
jgi:hypothetical protein